MKYEYLGSVGKTSPKLPLSEVSPIVFKFFDNERKQSELCYQNLHRDRGRNSAHLIRSDKTEEWNLML